MHSQVKKQAEDSQVVIDRRGGVTWLTLNRPEKLNALTPQMVNDLHEFLDALKDDRDTRIVVLRGAGRGFCAGMDLAQDPLAKALIDGGSDYERSPSYGMRIQQHHSSLVLKIHRAPQPFIGLIHGAASGAGFALALACDVLIAGSSLRMNAAFIRVGLTGCDMGCSYFLPRMVGRSVAAELMLTGDFIGAERALAVGLVSRLEPDDELEAAGSALAAKMAANSPMGLWLTKQCMNATADAGSLEAALALEDRNQVLATQHPDAVETAVAMREKRKPRYIG